MKLLITGGTGFIGKHLICNYLNDFEITILTRDIEKAEEIFTNPNPRKKLRFIDKIDQNQRYDSILNLAGESTSEGKWTDNKKKKIFDSRIETTKEILNYVSNLNSEDRPKILVNGSAIGYYGTGTSNKEINENSTPIETASLSHKLCRNWEREALKAEDFGIKTRIIRIGVVLGKNGGALKKMLPVFKFGLGGKIGSGKQYFSWIHLDDLCQVIEMSLKDQFKSQIINATAPKPITNEEFSKALGKSLKRPAILSTPEFIIKSSFGQMGEELLLSGHKVLPKNLLKEHFSFKHPTAQQALEEILK